MIRTAVLSTLLLVLAMLPAHGAPAPLGLFTIVDGDVVVLRDTHEFAAAEGLAVRGDDIVRSRDAARLARIEFTDGTVLDIGPASELMLQPDAFAAQAGGGVSLYLLRGWLKATTGPGKGAPTATLVSPQLGVARVAGSVVVHAAPTVALAFVESGRADVLERAAGRPEASHGLNDGDAFVAMNGAPGELRRRVPQDLTQGMPRAFTDSLPRRAAQWQGRSVQPGPPSEPGYASLAPWLNAEAALRPPFVKRFRPLAHDRAFRASVVADLRAHPEWGWVVFPDKYKTRSKPVVAERRPTASPTTVAERKARPAAPGPSVAPAPPAPPPAAVTAPATDAAIAQAPKTETP
ncbi:MAG: hypothetical protein ABI887_02130 [Burkholderiales bacterium]